MSFIKNHLFLTLAFCILVAYFLTPTHIDLPNVPYPTLPQDIIELIKKTSFSLGGHKRLSEDKNCSLANKETWNLFRLDNYNEREITLTDSSSVFEYFKIGYLHPKLEYGDPQNTYIPRHLARKMLNLSKTEPMYISWKTVQGPYDCFRVLSQVREPTTHELSNKLK